MNYYYKEKQVDHLGGGMPLGSLNSHTCISSPAETEILEDTENLS
jgi:hypothetical protein